VLSALIGKPSEFKRTPKFNGVTSQWKRTQYASVADNDMFWEIALGIYALFAGLLAYGLAPRLVVYFGFYAASFFTVAGWGVADRLVLERPVQAVHAEAEVIGQAGR
jgi:hypothetical protein